MSTSGSINFAVTRDDIITEALQIQGTLGDSDTPSADKLTSMSRTLNMMAKHWQAMGLNLFALQRTSLFLQKNVSKYSLGDTFANGVFYAKGEPGTTTTSAAAATSATEIVTTDDLSSILSANDYIGVLTDDNTLHWSTISSISGTTVNLTTALDNTVSAGNKIYYYTAANQMNRPMKIIQGSRVERSGLSIPLTIMTRFQYVELSDKGADGDSVNIYYDPQIGTGNLYVWTQADDESQYLDLWVQRTLEDFDAAGDNPDFPQEWYLALAYNLAMLTLPKQGVSKSTRDFITAMATKLYNDAEAFDTEHSTFIQPETRRTS